MKLKDIKVYYNVVKYDSTYLLFDKDNGNYSGTIEYDAKSNLVKLIPIDYRMAGWNFDKTARVEFFLDVLKTETAKLPFDISCYNPQFK